MELDTEQFSMGLKGLRRYRHGKVFQDSGADCFFGAV